MRRLIKVLMFVLLLTPGCKPHDAESGRGRDHETYASGDELAPPEVLVGRVVDAPTGRALAGVDVIELGSLAPHPVASDHDGGFRITPKSWTPLQVFALIDGRLRSSVALSARAGHALGGFVQLETWTNEEGRAWLHRNFGTEWTAGVAVVRVELIGVSADVAVGTRVEISALHEEAYVLDADGLWLITSVILEGAAPPAVVFVGVAAGSTRISVSAPPGLTCRGASSMEIFAESMNVVPVVCTPASGVSEGTR